MKKFISVEKYADNGAFSHYELVDENGETIIKDIMQAKKKESNFDKVEKEIQNRIDNTYKHSEKVKDRTENAKYESATTSLVLLKMWVSDNCH
jgi:hypothetical protein